ncbi:lipopolysaccharide biosynthesis protein (plasmid) [Salipiger sp. H15]|uniref:Lipopolysaccharide biosynthesis protein n=1 Tax=Alloyangia sp. H15 TaxID=3029062 RepID=A0AAU8AQW1_9RHOB
MTQPSATPPADLVPDADDAVAQSSGKKLGKALGWSTLHTLIPTISSMAIFFGGAFFLSPEDFGIVALSLAIVMIATAASPRAFGDALVQKQTLDDTDCSSVLWLNLLASIVLYSAVYLLAPVLADWFGKPDLAMYLRVLALRIPFELLAIVPQSMLIRRLEFRYVAMRTTAATSVSLTVCFALLFLGYGPWALIASQVSNSLILAVTGFIATRWLPSPTFSFERIRSVAHYGIFASGDRFLSMARLDQVLLGALVSAQALGLYYFAQRTWTMIIQVLSGALWGLLHSYLSRLQQDLGRVREAYSQFTLLASSVGFAIFALSFAVSEDLIALVLKPEWLPAAAYVKLFCVLGLFSVMEFLQGALMRSQGWARQWFLYRLAQEVGSVITIALLHRVSVEAILIAIILKSYILYPIQLKMSAQILQTRARTIFGWSLAPLMATLASVAVAWGVHEVMLDAPILARLVAETLALLLTYGALMFAMEGQQLKALKTLLRKKTATGGADS